MASNVSVSLDEPRLAVQNRWVVVLHKPDDGNVKIMPVLIPAAASRTSIPTICGMADNFPHVWGFQNVVIVTFFRAFVLVFWRLSAVPGGPENSTWTHEMFLSSLNCSWIQVEFHLLPWIFPVEQRTSVQAAVSGSAAHNWNDFAEGIPTTMVNRPGRIRIEHHNEGQLLQFVARRSFPEISSAAVWTAKYIIMIYI